MDSMGELNMGDLETQLQNSMSRTQIKYVLEKLLEDKVIEKHGQRKGTQYGLTAQYNSLRGDLLVDSLVHDLRSKYD